MLLPDYSASAAFISGMKLPARNLSDARECLLLLADIQSWQLCKQFPEEMRSREDAVNQNWMAKWIYKEVKISTGWQFECVFLTDPIIKRYKAFRIVVSEQGAVTIVKDESLGQTGGYI